VTEILSLPPRHFHDLELLAAEIGREYFPDVRPPLIRWGKKIGRRRRRSIRLGSYHPSTRVIRIHPLLDSSDVPRFFVESVIYHEYLHHVIGPAHNRRFHAHERRFRYHSEAREWLRQNLTLLLGRRSRPAPAVPRRIAPPEPVGGAARQLALF
jgi:hypothetical protein